MPEMTLSSTIKKMNEVQSELHIHFKSELDNLNEIQIATRGQGRQDA